jgi:hypothetical protein
MFRLLLSAGLTSNGWRSPAPCLRYGRVLKLDWASVLERYCRIVLQCLCFAPYLPLKAIVHGYCGYCDRATSSGARFVQRPAVEGFVRFVSGAGVSCLGGLKLVRIGEERAE